MVQEANVKRAQAEKALAESDMKVNTIQYSTSGHHRAAIFIKLSLIDYYYLTRKLHQF